MIAQACIQQLSQENFEAGVRHGDLHQHNVIFHANKAWFIDWGNRNVGDPMEEVAYYAYHVDFGMEPFAALLAKYAPLSQSDSLRAHYHLALLHAHRYLQTLRGMPWDRPEWRESKLRMHARYLAEDQQWLRDHLPAANF